MACYHPLLAYYGKEVNPATGRRPIVFNPRDGFSDMRLKLPCGQCIGCRLERSRQWAIRCMHEAQQHEQNSFITLTYEDKYLPEGGSLSVRDWQLFAKRLRRRGAEFRYFMCGEYGDQLSRPHYHACLFGFDFPDREQITGGRHPLYSSKLLDSCWPYGFTAIGDVTFESAAYVARYCVKKITGEKADDHYNGIQPEFTTMSRRPGIGTPWLEDYLEDVYPSDEVVIRGGIKSRPPRFYDSTLEKWDEQLHESVKKARKLRPSSEQESLQRLSEIERCKKLTLGARTYEKAGLRN